MTWTVITTPRFDEWYHEQNEALQDRVLHSLGCLQFLGPLLSRPYADSVKGSRFSNMKELRVQYCGRPLRVFYAFDFARQAILLCAGDKSNDKRFYETMIAVADSEFAKWLELREEQNEKL
ncbi:type II toxin-antitoxin system RelE/ParE family toxin [Dryocola sp. BD626]|uniref:type II toxin-antitoxin system RelE/ParE family toxin n=1 Tax=Dryocola sp. BD626 TaxID=3133273 RepID=UPI003F501313